MALVVCAVVCHSPERLLRLGDVQCLLVGAEDA